MQIGIDLRFITHNSYSHFICELVEELIQSDTKNSYTLYISSRKQKELLKNTNATIKNTNIPNNTFKEQLQLLKIYKKENNQVMVFFNHYKPLFYKGEYYTVIEKLKDVYYDNFDSFFKKYKYLYLLEKNLKNSKKVICLDENTKNELIERFNIKEEQIQILPGFFPNVQNSESHNLKIDIKAKYGLKNMYFLYPGNDGIEKNLEKLIPVIKKVNQESIKIDLIFLGDEISKNLALRNLIIESSLQENIKFLGNIKISEKELLYKESLGVVFPSFYEPFPFELGEALEYNVPILSSSLKSIRSIFGGIIEYFSPIAKSSITNCIENFLKNKKTHTMDYKNIKNMYNKENTAKILLEIIK